jgi:hypothetical protein
MLLGRRRQDFLACVNHGYSFYPFRSPFCVWSEKGRFLTVFPQIP